MFQIIQGGMGIGVSSYKLARTVCIHGGLGVVSGAAIDHVVTRRLQLGDPDGSMRDALSSFPNQEVATSILHQYFKFEGRESSRRKFKLPTLYKADDSLEREFLLIASAFCEVTAAKRGHLQPVGINLLHKIQVPLVPTLFGALLAGVDYVLVGAGIPRDIPELLERLSNRDDCIYKLEGGKTEGLHMHFKPKRFPLDSITHIHKPNFIPIISSHLLATMLTKKGAEKIDGFIVENYTAGGHNAPPRDGSSYGEKDQVDFEKIRNCGKPFWLAGGYGNGKGLKAAQDLGAQGIQVGTPFAFCKESGISDSIKSRVIDKAISKQLNIKTDFMASPSGYPFKILEIEGTLSDEHLYQCRQKVCDVGLLRETYIKEDGTIGYRCPSEPDKEYEKKGGKQETTSGKKCICNGLLSTIGLGQRTKDSEELPIITAGDNFDDVIAIVNTYGESYHAKDVMEHILGNR